MRNQIARLRSPFYTESIYPILNYKNVYVKLVEVNEWHKSVILATPDESHTLTRFIDKIFQHHLTLNETQGWNIYLPMDNCTCEDASGSLLITCVWLNVPDFETTMSSIYSCWYGSSMISHFSPTHYDIWWDRIYTNIIVVLFKLCYIISILKIALIIYITAKQSFHDTKQKKIFVWWVNSVDKLYLKGIFVDV